MEILKISYITVIGISFLVSLLSFRWNGMLHLKLFSMLLGLTFLTEAFAVYGLKMLNLQGRNAVYNIFMLVEFCAYTFYYRLLLKNKRITSILLLLLPVCWLFTTWQMAELNKWNSYFCIIGSCSTIILVVIYYIQFLYMDEPVNLRRHPEFVIATAMLIFYTCTMPYLGPLNYLVKNYFLSAVAGLAALRILNIILYSLFTYAFICQAKTMKS